MKTKGTHRDHEDKRDCVWTKGTERDLVWTKGTDRDHEDKRD